MGIIKEISKRHRNIKSLTDFSDLNIFKCRSHQTKLINLMLNGITILHINCISYSHWSIPFIIFYNSRRYSTNPAINKVCRIILSKNIFNLTRKTIKNIETFRVCDYVNYIGINFAIQRVSILF